MFTRGGSWRALRTVRTRKGEEEKVEYGEYDKEVEKEMEYAS
jgi:hypothetical protein